MPLDTSIALQVKPYQGPDIAKLMSLQDMSQKMQMQNMQMDEYGRKRQSENALRELFSKNPNASAEDVGRIDHERSLKMRELEMKRLEQQSTISKNTSQGLNFDSQIEERKKKERDDVGKALITAAQNLYAKNKDRPDAPEKTINDIREYWGGLENTGVWGASQKEIGRTLTSTLTPQILQQILNSQPVDTKNIKVVPPGSTIMDMGALKGSQQTVPLSSVPQVGAAIPQTAPATAPPAQANFPRITPEVQQGRNAEQVAILERELTQPVNIAPADQRRIRDEIAKLSGAPFSGGGANPLPPATANAPGVLATTPGRPKDPLSAEGKLLADYNAGRVTKDQFDRKSQGSDVKPPTGFRVSEDGNLEFIPGGPADPKFQEEKKGIEKQVKDLGAAFEKAKLNETIAVVDQAGKITPEQAKYLTGPMSLLPDISIPKDARDARQDLAKLFNITLKDRSGAAVTNQELQRLKEEFGKGLIKTPDQVITAIGKARSIVESHYQGIAAGYGEKVLSGYNDNLERVGGRRLEFKATGQNRRLNDNPKVGDVQQGYKYKGGNPADKSNWEKQ